MCTILELWDIHEHNARKTSIFIHSIQFLNSILDIIFNDSVKLNNNGIIADDLGINKLRKNNG